MRESRLRVRALLDARFALCVLVLLALAGAGAWASYGAHVAPGTHVERHTVDSWRANGSFTHRATVVHAENVSVFEDGQVVRNRSVYFRRLMPVLDGTFRLDYAGDGAPLHANVTSRLVVASVADRGGTRTVYWRTSDPLASTETTVEPGGRATLPFRLNVTRTLRDARARSDRLGSPGRLNATVRVTATVRRERPNARPHTLTAVLPIEAGSNVYAVRAAPASTSDARTETVTVPNAVGPPRALGGPLLLLAGLGGLLALSFARWRGALALDETEREWLAYRDDRRDYDEWIVAVRLPDAADALPVADAASLADLVDFAIDTDNAVLESPADGAYHVVHDGYHYTYRPPDPPD